jgi:elongation factor G
LTVIRRKPFLNILSSSPLGKGEFSMEYREHAPVSKDIQEKLIKDYIAKRAEEND